MSAIIDILEGPEGLTPQQVLSASLYDVDIMEIESVVIISVTKDGEPVVNWSTMTAGTMAYLLAVLQAHVMSRIVE